MWWWQFSVGCECVELECDFSCILFCCRNLRSFPNEREKKFKVCIVGDCRKDGTVEMRNDKRIVRNVSTKMLVAKSFRCFKELSFIASRILLA